MRTSFTHRAFTLIELLVVMIVIAIIIAIVVPALGSVRNSARTSGTAALLNDVNQAVSKFEMDQRRTPGYFDERAMGHTDNNANAGMASLENIMLELMGAEIATGATAPTGGATWIQVGPAANNFVWVNMDTLGSSAATTAYYTPAAKNYVAQSRPVQQIGAMGNAALDGQPQLADLVDMWGQPILAWRKDETTRGTIANVRDFADTSAPTAANRPGARYYWRSNAAFLNSQALGRRGRDQTDAANGSLIAENVGDVQLRQSMTAFLGHPGFPIRTGNTAPTLPSEGRSKIVLHSAGADGVYFGRKDRGARQFLNGAPMLYEQSFVSTAGIAHQTTDGKVDVRDIVREFDDLISAAGN